MADKLQVITGGKSIWSITPVKGTWVSRDISGHRRRDIILGTYTFISCDSTTSSSRQARPEVSGSPLAAARSRRSTPGHLTAMEALIGMLVSKYGPRDQMHYKIKLSHSPCPRLPCILGALRLPLNGVTQQITETDIYYSGIYVEDSGPTTQP